MSNTQDKAHSGNTHTGVCKPVLGSSQSGSCCSLICEGFPLALHTLGGFLCGSALMLSPWSLPRQAEQAALVTRRAGTGALEVTGADPNP